MRKRKLISALEAEVDHLLSRVDYWKERAHQNATESARYKGEVRGIRYALGLRDNPNTDAARRALPAPDWCDTRES